MMLAVEVPHAISGTVHTTFGVPGDHCSEHSLLPLQPANHPICLRPNPFESRTLLHTIRVQPLLINMEPVPIRSRRGIGSIKVQQIRLIHVAGSINTRCRFDQGAAGHTIWPGYCLYTEYRLDTTGYRLYPTCTGNTPSVQLGSGARSEEHTSELQSRGHLVCRLLLEKKT